MSFIYKTNVWERVSGFSGTSSVSLPSTPQSGGFQSFTILGANCSVLYSIRDAVAGVWENGIGTYTLSGSVLARTTVLENSSGTTSNINFSGANTLDITLELLSPLSVSAGAASAGLLPALNTSGLLDNSFINWAAPSAIGGGTAAAGTFTTLTATNLQISSTTASTIYSTTSGGVALNVGYSGGSIKIYNMSNACSWIDMPTSGPSGLGTGGPGINPWIGYASGSGAYFVDAAAGDVVYRNTSGSLRFGVTSNYSQLQITSSAVSFTTSGGTALGSITSTGLNSMAIGATTPATGAFTNLAVSGTFSGAGLTSLFAPYQYNGSTTANTFSPTGTGPFTLTASQSGLIIKTSGITAAATINLPSPALGLNFVILGNQYTVSLSTPSGSILRTDGVSVNPYVISASYFDGVQIYSDGSNWLVRSAANGFLINLTVSNTLSTINLNVSTSVNLANGYVANVAAAGNYFNDSSVNDTVVRASSGSLRFGASSGSYSQVIINSTTIGFQTTGGTGIGNITSTGLNGMNIGVTTPSSGAFTTLSASGTVSGAGFTSLLSSYALLSGATFSGTVSGPTASPGTNTTQLATTAFVAAAITSSGSYNAASVAITGGTINGTTIGATTASTGAFTTLSASSTVSGAGFTSLLSPYQFNGTTGGNIFRPTGAGPGITLTASQSGMTIYTDSLTGAVTFTLPTNASGLNFSFFSNATNIIIISAPTGTIDFPDGTTAASYTLPLGIYNSFYLIADGTNWRAETTGGVGKFASIAVAGLTTTATLTATGLITPSTTAGIKGTTLADNAQAGSVGELLTNSVSAGSAVSLTTATVGTILTLSLTAGDWDIWGTAAFTVSSTMTTCSAAVNTTSNMPGPTAGGIVTLVLAFTSAGGQVLQTGSIRVNVSTTTTVYLIAKNTFAGTCSGYGVIFARRVR